MNNNMVFCPKCGNQNMPNTSFCNQCGNQLPTQSNFNQPMNNNYMQNNMQSQNNYQSNQQVNNQNIKPETKDSMNYFKYMFNAILKPHAEFKKQEKNLNNFKHGAILSLILVGALTIINLINTMINTVRVESFWSDEVEWVWENLKEVEYFKIIFQNLLIYAGVLFAIAGIYFLAALVIKKDVKFQKLLGIVVTAFIPIMISTSVISPILSLIYSPLGLIINAVGLIYGILILIELINDVVVLEDKNQKIYYHLTCISIFVVAIIIIFYVLLGSALSLIG